MATEAIPEQPALTATALVHESPEFIPKSAPVPEPPETASVVPSPEMSLHCVMSALRDCILYDTRDDFLEIIPKQGILHFETAFILRVTLICNAI